jgi:hypothetical protein
VGNDKNRGAEDIAWHEDETPHLAISFVSFAPLCG